MKMKNNWPKMGFVDVPNAGDVAKKHGLDASIPIVAVMKIEPNTPFRAGFKSGNLMQFCENITELDGGMFGMVVGEKPVTFFVFPNDAKINTRLSIVEFVNYNDDEKYKDLTVL